MNAIPFGWIKVLTSDVAQIVGGATPPSKDEACFTPPGQGIPWITPADLSGYRDQTISRGTRDLSTKGLASCSAKVMPTGTVLFSSRAPIGYVAIASNPIATNQGFKSFVLPKEIDSRFAYYQLKHIKPVAEALATGTTFKELSGSTAAKLPLLVAPYLEQKRIADKLDTVLTRIDAVNTRLARVAPLLKRFRQSVLAAATSGRLTEEWRLANGVSDPQALTLGELIKVSSGDGLTAKEMKSAGGVPVYGGNGINGHHDQSNVSAPTIVIGRVGFYCGSVHLTSSIAWVTDNALRVKFDPTKLDRKYLYFALQGTDLRQNMSSTAQPVISGQKIYPLSFNLPTLPEQTEIVRRVETLFSFADRLEARVQTAQTAADRLTPSLLAKAFRGELVPQDPNDEPASELLKRLAAAPATLTRKRRSKTTS
jgi:type I restriction enzyme, S subunit